MLDIYYGDGFTDKEKYIFENIDPKRKTILIVPDQFSLQAERDAFRLMGRESLTNLMIVDFSALGHKVVHEIDGHEPEVIDKYGRHMLLTVLMEDLGDDLKTYGSFKGGNSFIEHMNTMISQLKRYEISVDMLEDICSRIKERGQEDGYAQAYLHLKLTDILNIYRAYEDAVNGIYQDAEDYITYYAERIPDSNLVKGADIWIYGFDTFTPKNLGVIKQLIKTGDSVSVVLTGTPGSVGAPGGSDSSSSADPASGAGDPDTVRNADSAGSADPFVPPDGAATQDSSNAADPVRGLTLNDGENLFDITETVSRMLEDLAREAGVEYKRHFIEEERANIWNTFGDNLGERINLVTTSDHFHEGERAAAYIRHLIRDEGYRYRDIVVICNDSEDLGGMVTRALRRTGVPVFSDRRRSVLHQPVVSFLLSFMDVIQHGYRGDGMIGMIKSGLLGLEQYQENLIDNYVNEFRIRSSKWKDPFIYKGDRYSDEDLQKINGIRGFLADTCDRARDSIGRRNTAEEKVKGLQKFLEEDFDISHRIEELVESQKSMDLEEGAAETTQIWNAVCGIFDQIIKVVGQNKISNQTLSEMIRAGLTSMEIGLVPFSVDSLLMGTLQRTRPGQIKALVIVGAEEGLLPLHSHDEGLLTKREIQVLEEMDLELARRDKVSAQEEQLAIYRMFSLPTERLYVSCSQTGKGGSAARPSSVFEKLKKYQPRIKMDLDKHDMIESVVDRNMTLSYLARAMKSQRRHESFDPGWEQVRDWYGKHDPASLKRMWRAAGHNNRTQALGDEMAEALFVGDRRELTVSASRLERFNGCPFAHFIQYGLVPVEQRLFEVGGREIGDLYHQCIMKYCERLSEGTLTGGAETASAAGGDQTATAAPGAEASTGGDQTATAASAVRETYGSASEDKTSAGAADQTAGAVEWQDLTREECGAIIREIMNEEKGYREGLFDSDEENRFRLERATEICGDIAWAITQQIRQGQINSMKFEESFGYGKDLPAMEFDIDGKKAKVKGRIDRIDVLGEGDDKAVRIIDYKTGGNQIDPEEIRKGYQLQLAVYMDAAKLDMQPAGIFYFKIKEHLDDKPAGTEVNPEELERQLKKAYRLEGISVSDPAVLGSMDRSLLPDDKYESMVVPVKYEPSKESFAPAKGGILMSPEEFADMLEESKKVAEDICRRIYKGEIRPEPHKTGNKDRYGNEITACTYCDFGSICMHDL